MGVEGCRGLMAVGAVPQVLETWQGSRQRRAFRQPRQDSIHHSHRSANLLCWNSGLSAVSHDGVVALSTSTALVILDSVD